MQKKGTKKIPKQVARSIPPITPVPTQHADFGCAPAPELITRGKTPKINVREVMMMAWKALTGGFKNGVPHRKCPSFLRRMANSTIKIAFFAANAIKVTSPI